MATSRTKTTKELFKTDDADKIAETDDTIENNTAAMKPGVKPLAAPSPVEPTEPAPPTTRRFSKHAGIGNARLPKQSGPQASQPSGDAVASLGSLEAEVLGVLWEIGRPATGMEVMETALYKARAQGNEPASFSTIATTLRRLTGKGLLKSQKIDGRTPVFWPTVEREQMAARILNNVSATLLGVSLHSLLPRLIGRALPDRAGSQQSTSRQHQEPAAEEEIARLLHALEETAARETKWKPED